MHYSIHKQSGVALLTAMLVVAIATIAAISMTSRQQLDIRRTENILHAEQAYLYVLAGELWARSALKEDLDKDKKQGVMSDDQTEDWATNIQNPIEGGQLAGHLEDLQGKFNLNNLYVPAPPAGASPSTGTQPPSIDFIYFQELLRTLGLPTKIAHAVQDWIDLDTSQSGSDGAEDVDYQSKQPPYRTGNAQMASLSELRLVDGIDEAIYTTLAKHVTVLPGTTPINVNTASAEVIAAMSSGIDVAEAENIIEELRPITDKQIFIPRLKLPPTDPPDTTDPKATTPRIINDLIEIKSNYFLLDSTVVIGRSQLKHFSIIERTNAGETFVVSRERGTF